MPKLAANIARASEEAAEEGGPQPLPPGVYIGQLFEVEISAKPGDSGYHYWTWKYKIQDEGYRGREQRHITSLSPASAFAIGGAFKAYGVPADTDTDELIGRRVQLKVSQQVISKGSREGETGNRVDYIMPMDESQGKTPLDEDF